MVDEQLRKVKDRILFLVAGPRIERIPPNIITTAGFSVGLICAVFLYFGCNLIAFFLWIFNRIIDGLDGYVARQNGNQTDFGGYYDIITDFIIYALLPGVIALRENSLTVSLLVVLLLGVFYVNGASWMYLSGLLQKRRGGMAGKIQTSLEMPRGLIEGTETILFYSLFILLPRYLVWLIPAMAVLTAAGIVQRLIYARKHL